MPIENVHYLIKTANDFSTRWVNLNDHLKFCIQLIIFNSRFDIAVIARLINFVNS